MSHSRAPLAAALVPLALLASGCAMLRPSHPTWALRHARPAARCPGGRSRLRRLPAHHLPAPRPVEDARGDQRPPRPHRLPPPVPSIERAAWGAFHTEFYPTYDFIPVWKDIRTRALSQEPAH